MFPKNSAFTPDADTTEHLEGVRKRALNSVLGDHVDPKIRAGSVRVTALTLVESAEMYIDEGVYDAAMDALRHARELLENAD